MKYSNNKKLDTVLTGIEEQIIYGLGDGSREAAAAEISRYAKEFKKEPDFNIAQYGNVLVYYADVYEFYRSAGYKSTDNYSAAKIWETYCRQVGYVARQIMKEQK